MKYGRLILFSIVLCVSTVLSAQQLDMNIQGSVELREMDSDARAYKWMDRNDYICALLKVTLTNPLPQNTLLSLAVGDLPVIHSELKDNGEYWFYVPYLVKNLYFSCRGYKAMEPVPVVLKQGKVYRITIRNEVRSDGTITVSSNYLKMNIFPEDAEVAIGKTLSYELPKEYLISGKFSRRLDYGDYYIKVTHPLYAEKTMIVTVSDNDTPVEVRLAPAYGYLSINTNPPGALVIINGERVNGTTPLKIPEKIRTGSVSVTVQKQDWHPATVSVNVPSDGSVKTVDINLSANFGTVVCTCPDSEAELYVNGEYKGKGSWTGNVSSGINHVLESRKPGHSPQIIGFSVDDGQTLRKEVGAPVPLYGTLEITQTVPEYCIVRIDYGSETEAPFIRNELLEGSHTLHITKDGYIPQTRTIEIAHNQKLTLSDIRLEKGRRKVEANLSTGAESKIYGDNHEFLSNSSTWSGTLDEGWHDFYSSREGHNDGHIRAEVVYGKENNIRIPSPTVKTGTVRVTGTKNASLSLSGNGYGREYYTSPLTKQLPIGEYSLRASKKGYYYSDKTFNIYDGQTTDVSFELHKRHWISETQDYSHHFLEFTYGYGFTLGGFPGVDASMFTPPAPEYPDMEGDINVDYSSYMDKYDKAVRRSPHWYGLNYDLVRSHIGLHSSFAFTANGDIAAALGPNLRLSSTGILDFQLYAGLGFRYDPYSPVQDPLFKSNHWKWMVDAGMRFNIDIETSLALTSLTLGAKISSDKIIPTAGVSLLPAAMIYGDYTYFDDYLFGGLSNGYDTYLEHWMAGGYFSWVPCPVGLYTSFLVGLTEQDNPMYKPRTYSWAAGAVVRTIPEVFDLQLYGGLGVQNGKFMGDFGIRMNIDDLTADGAMFDIGVGCQVYDGHFVPTFTFGIGLSLIGGWLVPLLCGLHEGGKI